MFDRRDLLKGAGLAAMAATLNSTKALALDTVTLPFDNGERPLVKYPQKRPMIGLTSRPPQLETPFAVFNEGADHAERRVLRALSSRRHPATTSIPTSSRSRSRARSTSR